MHHFDAEAGVCAPILKNIYFLAKLWKSYIWYGDMSFVMLSLIKN
jgi:hypothetical protein